MVNTFRYKNISPQPQALIGFGLIQPGEEFETDQEVVNANFEEVTGDSKSPKKKPK